MIETAVWHFDHCYPCITFQSLCQMLRLERSSFTFSQVVFKFGNLYSIPFKSSSQYFIFLKSVKALQIIFNLCSSLRLFFHVPKEHSLRTRDCLKTLQIFGARIQHSNWSACNSMHPLLSVCTHHDKAKKSCFARLTGWTAPTASPFKSHTRTSQAYCWCLAH